MFENVIFTCPAPGIVGKFVTAQMHNGNNHFRAVELSVYDCPNTFFHLDNKCYKFLEADTWFNQYQSCKQSKGVLLSIYNQPQKLIKMSIGTVFTTTKNQLSERCVKWMGLDIAHTLMALVMVFATSISTISIK